MPDPGPPTRSPHPAPLGSMRREQHTGSRPRASEAGERKHKHEIVAVIGGSENTEEMRGLYETSADKKRGDVRQPSRIRNP